MSWTNKYIGIPYKPLGRDISGVDCYGLCVVVYKNEFNIDIPEYTHIGIKRESTQEKQDILNRDVSNYIKDKSKEHWQEIPFSEAKEFDFMLFKVCGFVTHIALYVGNNKIIHSFNGRDCVIEDIYPKWQGRIYKVLRWQKLD